MTDFVIHFLICNILISGLTVILSAIKKIFKKQLTCRTHYMLWFLPFLMTIMPFIPLKTGQVFPFDFNRIQKTLSPGKTSMQIQNTLPSPDDGISWINDFTISVSSRTPSLIWAVLFFVWLIGILVMTAFVLRSSLHLHKIKKSALPLQNKRISQLYGKCMEQMHIRRSIPVYSTAYLSSPALTGFITPRIYLPIHLISDFEPEEIHFILLHELQHYRCKDNFSNYLLLFAGIFYWFNPVIRIAAKSMRSDRELACDAAVLNMLDPNLYRKYGYTLINFAEKISLFPYPFSVGLSGSMRQMEKRIRNIADYKKPAFSTKFRSTAFFIVTALLSVCFIPALTSYGASVDQYKWDTSAKHISHLNLDSYFGQYDGCFILYSPSEEKWSIYNMDLALNRTSPDSTYKIYDALLALEENIITPDYSLMKWDGEIYPFETWNRDQNLSDAMASSVNWYFQSLDRQLGNRKIQNYLDQIGYGNKDIGDDLSSYWMQSSLKISPVEQVELLNAFYQNSFGFSPENIQAVKDSLYLSTTDSVTLYGKTGTGRVDGKDINGWFIGFTETQEKTYFFATNIQAEAHAAGSNAADITLSILSDLQQE